jgi:hypothetical protein
MKSLKQKANYFSPILILKLYTLIYFICIFVIKIIENIKIAKHFCVTNNHNNWVL